MARKFLAKKSISSATQSGCLEMPKTSTSFKPGHKVAVYPRGPNRADMTTELITQLNEILADKHYIEKRHANRTKMHRVVKNLITLATCAAPRHQPGRRLRGAHQRTSRDAPEKPRPVVAHASLSGLATPQRSPMRAEGEGRLVSTRQACRSVRLATGGAGIFPL